MWSSPYLWVVLVVTLFWAVGAYNRLVRLRSAVIQAFGSLDAHMVRWLAMLGELDAARGATGILQGEARSTLQAASTQLSASLAVARARPLQADAVAALSAACGVMDTVWHNLQPAEGDAEASRQMAPWCARWDELRTYNAQAVQLFNDAVGQYNAAIGQFPAVLLAWVFGFSPARVLSIVRKGQV